MLAALTDFSDRRPELWRNIDRAHFEVHEHRPGFADVTEGNVLAWERNRYAWDAGAGDVTVTTVESDTWKAGSQWRYHLLPAPGGGTVVDVTVVRSGKGVRGRVIGIVIALFGRALLKSDMEKVLARF